MHPAVDLTELLDTASQASNSDQRVTLPDDGSDDASVRSGIREAVKRKLRATGGYEAVREQYHQLRSLRDELVFLWRSYRDVKRFGIDQIVLTGSHPLYDDWDGAWEHPYNVWKWSIIARLAGAEFLALNVGAGPIDEPLSRRFLKGAVDSMTYRSYRDSSSAEAIRSLGVSGDHPVFPDLAFSYPATEVVQDAGGRDATDPRPLIGISTTANRDPRYQPRGADSPYDAYLSKVSGFIRWAVEHGFRVQFLYSDYYSDPRVGADLKLRLRDVIDLEADLIEEPLDSVEDFLGHVQRCDYVVGGRFHSHILPFVLGKPVLAVAYHQKTLDLMEYMGLKDYVLDMDDMTSDTLIDRFEALVDKADAIRSQVRSRVASLRRPLVEQYARLYGPAVVEPVATASVDVPSPR